MNTIPNPKRCLVLLLALATIISGQSKVDNRRRTIFNSQVRGVKPNSLLRSTIDDHRVLGVSNNNQGDKKEKSARKSSGGGGGGGGKVGKTPSPKSSDGDSEEEDEEEEEESAKPSHGEGKSKGSEGTKSARGKSKKNPKEDGTEHFDQGKLAYSMDCILHQV
jgi:hypothetical protein